MKPFVKICLALIATAFIAGCSNVSDTGIEPKSSIYHWKTTFDINDAETEFLEKHDIERIYIKMFDVATEYNFLIGVDEVIPIATTQFISPIPDGVEVIPVVYITIDALRNMIGREEEFAYLVIERMLAMCRHNNCGEIRELQLDCDWTSETKNSYNAFCLASKDILKEYNIALSATIRLHQLQESAPPVDKGVLMLYNTGALKNPETQNSILDIKDVKPYLKTAKYSIPLDYAYPAFGWGVKFKENKFVAIVTDENEPTFDNEIIRKERCSATDILEVKSLVERKLGKPASGNIIYHLDETQLKNYTDDEIAQIFAY